MLRGMSRPPEPSEPPATNPARAKRNALFIALAGVLLIITLSGLMALLIEAMPPPTGPDGPVPAPADAPPSE